MAINPAGFYNPNVAPVYYPTTPVTPQPTQTPSSTLVWVQGEGAAKVYPVAPGNKVALFDSENPVVYIKEVDMFGKPFDMEIYDLVKREVSKEPPEKEFKDYVTREEMLATITTTISEEIDKAMSEISLKPTSKKKKGDDE